jgi:basic endochitinase B
MRSAITSIFFVPTLLLLSVLSMNCSSKSNNNSSNNDSTSAPVTDSHQVKVSSFLSEQQFNALFPMHDKFYSYQAFMKAIDQLGDIKIKVSRRAASVYQIIRTDRTTGKTTTVRQDEDWNEAWAKVKPDSVYYVDYSDFCSSTDIATDKKELAAFFAQIAHETRHGQDGQYNDGLMFTHENDTTNAYLADNDDYPPVKGQKYYGRGPMQLSYNGNYGYASMCIFGDKNILLKDPNLVQHDPVVAFETAIYFWMTPQTHKPSAHDAMTGKWQPTATDKAANRISGFGETINIINGPIECGKGDNMAAMNDRIGFYKHFLQMLGASDPNCVCSCGTAKPYAP